MRRFALLLPALVCQAQAPVQELPASVKQKVLDACFEIVVPKAEGKGITYEKDLPWDLLPFHIRTDAYLSIGTAFAVSSTELVTAFHVLDLLQPSLTYRQFYLRDREKRVFEIDQILASHEQKDVVRFTVKHRTFRSWLDFRPAFDNNLQVWTAGNAFGESIVVRKGDILGTVPEEMDGQFQFIKSSADVNGGNSGGPLVDQDGKVVGVVLRKRDNVSYSLPAAEILNLRPATAVYRNKTTYGFFLLPTPSKPVDRNFTFTLPLHYQALKLKVNEAVRPLYSRNMEALFKAEGMDLFPGNATGDEAVHDFPAKFNPEVAFKDKNSGRWTFSGLEYKTHEFGRNGKLHIAMSNDIMFSRIRKPDDVDLGELQTKPKLMMDLLFKALNIPRDLAGQKIRITSLGEPLRSEHVTDRLGRPWNLNVWHLDFEDQVGIVFSTPTPSGVAMVARFVNSSALEEWVFDLTHLLDFTYLSYSGRLKDWQAFLAHPERLPAALKGLKVSFETGKVAAIDSPWFTGSIPESVLAITPNTNLGINLGFHPHGKEPHNEFRRLVMDEYDTNNYFVLVKHLKPLDGMLESETKTWKEVAKERHPYTQKSFSEDGRTNIAGTYPGEPGANGPRDERPSLFTLYMGREGSVDDQEMKTRYSSLAKALTLRSQHETANASGSK